MSNLQEYLINHIKTHGPIDIGQFMNIALGHPEHGYYMKKDPFGRGGDFTTAPEISQMFGEVIGAWIADVWAQMGSPKRFALLECGPGRGTLMADILRAVKMPCDVHFLEMSPVLKELQGKAVKNATWHETLETVPRDQPIIVIANEFLDALPVRQLQRTESGWMERVVGYSTKFEFGLRPVGIAPPVNAEPGDIFEIAPARASFVKNLCGLIKQTGGVALFIDYGHTQSAAGDTLQAMYKHKYCPVLEHIGDADLTAHVDFAAVNEEAQQNGMKVFGPVEQGAFLKAIGIEARAGYLSARAKDGNDIQIALKRLTDSGQMGSLFKVTGFSYGPSVRPAGF